MAPFHFASLAWVRVVMAPFHFAFLAWVRVVMAPFHFASFTIEVISTLGGVPESVKRTTSPMSSPS
jgi:hypothetical protein